MLYQVSFCLLGSFILQGPDDFDIKAEYDKWIDAIKKLCGETPNIVCYGDHREWLKRYLLVLESYQKQYNCTGDLSLLFIEHLIQRCGFSRREYRAVRLG